MSKRPQQCDTVLYLAGETGDIRTKGWLCYRPRGHRGKHENPLLIIFYPPDKLHPIRQTWIVK